MQKDEIAGSYQLRGIMETAAGLELYPDGKFDFYYVYGAIDRHAYGSWEISNEQIILNSLYTDKTGYDILLSEQRTQPRFTIYFPKADPFFISMQGAFAINGDQAEEQKSDKKGWFLFQTGKAERIMLSNDLFPDRMITIENKDTSHNHIELAPNHDLLLIHFTAVEATMTEDVLHLNSGFLKGMHGDRDFKFYKVAH